MLQHCTIIWNLEGIGHKVIHTYHRQISSFSQPKRAPCKYTISRLLLLPGSGMTAASRCLAAAITWWGTELAEDTFPQIYFVALLLGKNFPSFYISVRLGEGVGNTFKSGGVKITAATLGFLQILGSLLQPAVMAQYIYTCRVSFVANFPHCVIIYIEEQSQFGLLFNRLRA